MFDLSPEELSRTIWDLDAFEVSKSDTLKPEQLKQFQEFFHYRKPKVFELGKNATHYAFYGREHYYSGGTIKYSSTFSSHDYLCHYYWTYGANPEYTTGLINIFPNNCRPKINSIFWKYLLSPTESPYRDALKDLWIIRSNESETKGFPMALLWTDVSKTPVLLLTHLLIASRLLTGWSLDIVFKRLLDMGFSPPNAMILSTLFEFKKQTVTGSESFGNHFKRDKILKTLTAFGPHVSDQPFGRYMGENDQGWQELSPQKFANGDYSDKFVLADVHSNGVSLNKTNHIWFGDKPFLRGQLGVEVEYSEDEYDEWGDFISGGEDEWVKKKDDWNLYDQVVGKSRVDKGLIAELENRMSNGILVDFNNREAKD